jgi:hypothetical protein
MWITYSTLHLKLSPLASLNGVDPSQLPQTRANVEVTLSILSRGLEAHPANIHSADLHLQYLQAAEAFWPAEKVTARWKNVLRELQDTSEGAEVDQHGIMKVWLGYIAWREGVGFGKGGSTVGVDEVIDVYIECIETLRKLDGELCPSTPHESSSE